MSNSRDMPMQAAIVERLNVFTAQSLGARGDPAVALVIVDDHGALSCEGFGSDRAGRPTTCDTPFAIASLTKSITALAIVQLAERQALVLDAPVTTYLPWFSTADGGGARITVRDALEQRSGFDTATGLAWLGTPGSVRTTIEARVRALTGVRLTSEPGTTFAYSNANYDVLGAIVERMSGSTYLA